NCATLSSIFSSVIPLHAEASIPDPSSGQGFLPIKVDQTIKEATTYNTRIEYILQSGDYFASTRTWVRRIDIFDIFQTDNIGFPDANLSYGKLGDCLNITIIIFEADTNEIHASNWHNTGVLGIKKD
ncbi:25603_t:CDS:2, partial [Gigaspora margarita]